MEHIESEEPLEETDNPRPKSKKVCQNKMSKRKEFLFLSRKSLLKEAKYEKDRGLS